MNMASTLCFWCGRFRVSAMSYVAGAHFHCSFGKCGLFSKQSDHPQRVRGGSRVTDEGEERLGDHLVRNQMIMALDLPNIIASAAGQALRYLAHHHWFFGFVLFCYVYRLHDRSVHARFSALDKRVDEIRKRLACDI
jgi:hypothetical protein